MRLFALLIIILCQPAVAADHMAVAVIIDDIGHNYKRGLEAIRLEGAFTYAILPQTQYAVQLATEAHKARKEIMVHVPMESIAGLPFGIEGEGLEKRMNREEFDRILGALIDSVPYASGVNNHQGSRLTQQMTQMHWLMDEVYKRKMYFVDSKTTHRTVAEDVAFVRQIFASTRDVFLDVEKSEEYVARSFDKLIKIAERKGTAIAIGHPHRVTINFLKSAKQILDNKNIALVPASNLIALQKINTQTPINSTSE